MLTDKQRAIAQRILKELNARLGFLVDVGLSYLTLARGAAQTGEEYHMTLAAGSETVFVLGWLWRHNDPVDTVAGESGMIYKLHITFTASVVLD